MSCKLPDALFHILTNPLPPPPTSLRLSHRFVPPRMTRTLAHTRILASRLPCVQHMCAIPPPSLTSFLYLVKSGRWPVACAFLLCVLLELHTSPTAPFSYPPHLFYHHCYQHLTISIRVIWPPIETPHRPRIAVGGVAVGVVKQPWMSHGPVCVLSPFPFFFIHLLANVSVCLFCVSRFAIRRSGSFSLLLYHYYSSFAVFSTSLLPITYQSARSIRAVFVIYRFVRYPFAPFNLCCCMQLPPAIYRFTTVTVPTDVCDPAVHDSP